MQMQACRLISVLRGQAMCASPSADTTICTRPQSQPQPQQQQKEEGTEPRQPNKVAPRLHRIPTCKPRMLQVQKCRNTPTITARCSSASHACRLFALSRDTSNAWHRNVPQGHRRRPRKAIKGTPGFLQVCRGHSRAWSTGGIALPRRMFGTLSSVVNMVSSDSWAALMVPITARMDFLSLEPWVLRPATPQINLSAGMTCQAPAAATGFCPVSV